MRARLKYLLASLFFSIRDRLSSPKVTLMEVGIRPGFCVLDFGCGIGGYTLAAAELVGADGRVYAVDADPRAVETVRKRAARAGLANVEVFLSDCSIPLDDQSVDVVLLYDVFHDLKQPKRVLGELARVLKSDGILSFSDHHMREAQILSRVTADKTFALVQKGDLTYTFAPAEGRG